MFTINIPQGQLKALLLHTPKTDIRKYLNGLHLFKTEGGPCIAEATDGKRCLRIELVNDTAKLPPFDVIVPRDLMVKVASGKYGFFEIDGDTITEPFEKATAQSLTSEGKFPDCERVCSMRGVGMHDTHPGEFCLNQLIDAAKAIDLLDGRKAKKNDDLVRAPKLTYSLDKAESALAADLAYTPLGRPEGYERTAEEVAFLRKRSQANATAIYRTHAYVLAVMPLRA